MTDAEADRIVPTIIKLFVSHPDLINWIMLRETYRKVPPERENLQLSCAIRQIIEEGLDRDE